MLTAHIIASYASHAFFLLVALSRFGANGDPLVAGLAFLLAPVSYPILMVASLVWPDNVGDGGWYVAGYALAAAAAYFAMRERGRRQRLPVAAG